jgi:hypothetical protein
LRLAVAFSAWRAGGGGKSRSRYLVDTSSALAFVASALWLFFVARKVGSMTTNEVVIPRLGPFSALRRSLPRDELFAGLYIVGCANGLGLNVVRSLISGDWTGGLQNISVIVLFACFAGVSLLLRDKSDEIRATDVAFAVVFLGLIVFPVTEFNWVAVTGLSFYILLCANDGSVRRRGAVIMLAVTVPMLWSKLLFSFLAKFFLEIDASLVGWLLGTARTGNIIQFADGSGNMVILPACSSLANVSLAFLCWVAVAEWVGHQRSRQDIFWCLLACAAVVAINVGRISLMGLSHWHYLTFHYGWGATAANAIILTLTVGITLFGVRREVFSHP